MNISVTQKPRTAIKAADAHLLKQGIEVLRTEAAAIAALSEQLDTHFIAACHALFSCQGRVLVLGIGKSGHIGKKIAATLYSTGTPSFFIPHPEAAHCGFGLITKSDTL